MSAITAPRLLTAEEFGELPNDGVRSELVCGEVIEMNVPYPRHGEICLQVGHLLKVFLEANPIGRAVGNDSGVVTERDPDTVRGADISFYSFGRVPAGPLPRNRYLGVVPELVFEVRSWTDRWADIHTKVAEYLSAGVGTVVVLDEQTQQAWRYGEDGQRVFDRDTDLELPPPLDGWRVPVRRFFE